MCYHIIALANLRNLTNFEDAAMKTRLGPKQGRGRRQKWDIVSKNLRPRQLNRLEMLQVQLKGLEQGINKFLIKRYFSEKKNISDFW